MTSEQSTQQKCQQFLFDGHPAIFGMTPGLHYQLHRPTVMEDAVFQGSHEVDALGVSYASVVRDAGQYRMWYQAWPKKWDEKDVLRVGLAQSDDGIVWKRCNCNLVEVNGSKANPLINLPIHSANIIIQESAPSDQRYRVFGYFHPRALVGIPGNFDHLADYDGYVTATSADGIYWPPENVQPIWDSRDVISAAPLPQGGAMLIMKQIRFLRGLARRTFSQAYWRNNQMTQPLEALVPDLIDEQMSIEKGFLSADYYGIGLDPRADGATLGFLWNFRHQSPMGTFPEEYRQTWGNLGQVDISVVAQFSPGGAWHHFPGRPTWLDPTNVPEWADGCIYTSPHVIHCPDQSRMYFTGSREYHGWTGAGIDYIKYFSDTKNEGGWARIGLAHWPKDRLISLSARFREKLYLNLTPKKGQSLKLNLKTKSNGQARVAILDAKDNKPLPGFSLEDCQPISGDHTAVVVHWNNKTNCQPAPHPHKTLIEIELTNAEIYAYSLES